MGRAFVAACACWATLAAAVEIPAGDVPVVLDVTTTTIGAWHADNLNGTSCDDRYAEALERLTATATRGPWTLGVRLDGALFFPVPMVREGTATRPGCNEVDLRSRYLPTLLPERVWGSYTGRLFEVTLGDSYVSFGRGLALSLRKNDELSTDTALRGARARLRTDVFTAQLVGGVTNIGNVDQASGRFAADPLDVVLGLQGEARLFELVRLGVHGVGYAFQTPLSTPSRPGENSAWQERWLHTGFTFDAPRLTSWLGVYAEGLWQRRWPIGGMPADGFGGYAAATFSVGPVTALLEGKAYGDLAVLHPRIDSIEFLSVQYSAPPTLERVTQPLEHPQRNIYGGRARLDWRVNDTLGLFAANGAFLDLEPYLDPETVEDRPGVIHDPTAGVDWKVPGFRVLGEAGWRFVFLPGREGAVRSDGHFEVTVQKNIGGPRSLELHVVHWERLKVLPLSEEQWREGSAQLGFHWWPVQAFAGLDYTTEPGQPQVWYPNGTLQWDITRATNLRLLAGSMRGGLRCVSGVCRVFPPFSGAKLTFTARF